MRSTVGLPNRATADDVVAAGYVGVRPRPRPDGLDARYVRDPLLSIAGDMVAVGPRLTWVGEADEALVSLGVGTNSVGDAKAWIDDAERVGDILYPDVCRTPDRVAEFADLFVPDGLAVLGVGLGPDQVDGFLAEHASSDTHQGILIHLREGRPLAPGYRTLGYEPVAVDRGTLGCSWTCNLLQQEVASTTGVVPNEWGFIDTAEQADAVMAFLADPAVGKEPGIWRAWIVVRYDTVVEPLH